MAIEGYSLMINSLADTTFSGLNDTTSGQGMSLSKTGPGMLTITGDTVYLRASLAAHEIWRGGLTFGGASGAVAKGNGTAHFALMGGTLTLDESSADINRYGDDQALFVYGGGSTFRYIGAASANSAESLGTSSTGGLEKGALTMMASDSYRGPTLSLVVNPGDGGTASVTFRSYYGGMGGNVGGNNAGILNVTTIGTLGTDARVLFANAPPLVNNVMAGAFVHGTDIATYDATKGLVAFNPVGGGGVAYVAAASAGVTGTAYLNGNFTLAADKQWNALKMDGAVEIDLNGNTLTLGKSGGGTDGLGSMVVKTGAGEAVIKGTTAAKYLTAASAGQAAHYAFMVNEGVLKVTAPLKGGSLSLRLNKMGSGVLWLDPSQDWGSTKNYSSYSSGIYFSDGVIRLNPSDAKFGNQTMLLNGGVMEITGGGTWTPIIGTGNRDVKWLTSGGFAAYGADAAYGNAIAWNAANQLPDGAALLLNSTTADSKITLSGILNLGTDAAKMYLREIEVADNLNSANDMAEISGQIISDTTAGGGGTPTYTYHLVKTGAGTLSLSHANNNFSGATYVKAGTLLVNGTLAAPASATVAINSDYYAVTVMTNATLGGTGTINRNVIVESGATLAPGGSPGLLTVNGNLTLAANSSYQWELQDGNGAAGSGWDKLVVNGDLLLPSSGSVFLDITQYATGFAWSSNAPASYLIAQGTFSSTDTNKFVLRMDSYFTPFTNLFTLSFASGNQLFLNYAGLSVPVSVWGGSNGNWNSGANWVAGGVPQPGHEAALQFNNADNLAYVSTNDLGAFELNKLAVSNMNAAVPVLVGTGGSSLVFTGEIVALLEQAGTGGFVISNDIQLATGLSAFGSGSGSLTIAGAISGSNNVSKLGNWTLVLSGTNSFVGTVTINAGTIAVNGSNALGDAANTVSINGGALSGIVAWADARTITLNNGTLSGATFTNLAGGVVRGAGTITAGLFNSSLLAASNGTLTVTGALGGDGTNRAVSGGTLALFGVNTFTRSVDIDGGTLLVTNSAGLGNAPVVFDHAGGTLLISNTTTFASSLNMTLNANGTISVATNSVAAWNGAIAGSGDLTKTGAGWLLLTNGTYNYTGVTLVSGGVFAVNGTLSSGGGAVTAQGGGTLGGTGTVLRAVVIGTGGTVSPGAVGAPLGTLAASNMTWASGGSYLWQAYNLTNTGTAGVHWDLIRLSGELTVSASSANPFTFRMQSLTNDFTPGFPTNWPSAEGHNEWLVLTAAGGITGFQQNLNVSVDSSQWQSPTNGYLFLSVQNGTNMLLNYDNLTAFAWGGATNRWGDGSSWVGNTAPGSGYVQLFFTNATAYTATNNISSPFQLGTLVVSNQTGDATAGNRIVGSNLNFIVSGGGIEKRGNGSFQIDNDLDLSAAIVIGGTAGTGTLTLMGNLAGNYSVTKAGNYNLILGGSNAAYSGTIFHNGGTLTFSNTASYALGGVSVAGTGAVVKAGTGTLALDASRVDLTGAGGLVQLNQGRLIVGGSSTVNVYDVSISAGSELVFTNGLNSWRNSRTDASLNIDGALRFTGGTNWIYSSVPSGETTAFRANGTVEVVNATAVLQSGGGYFRPGGVVLVNNGVLSNTTARMRTYAGVSVIITNGGKYWDGSGLYQMEGSGNYYISGSNSVLESSSAIHPTRAGSVVNFTIMTAAGSKLVFFPWPT